MNHTELDEMNGLDDEINNGNEWTIKNVLEMEKNLGIKFPLLHNLNENSLLKFKFKKCKNLFVTGSFILESMIKKPNKKLQNVDLVFEIPKECFQEKDHLNYRYFYKRSFYLSCLAFKLKEKFGSLFIYEFEYFQNDPLRPILILKSTDETSSHFTKKGFCIRLLPQMPATVFPIVKLSPSKNNIRPVKGTENIASLSAPLAPTPLYNSAIMQDINMNTFTDSLHACFEMSDGLKDAIILFKIWIEQRRFSGDRITYDFNGFLVSMIMVWLMTAKKGKRLNKGFSSFQIFKVTMDVIAKHNFTESPLFLTPTSSAIDEHDFSAKAFLENYEVAIVDPTGTFNLASGMTKSTMQEIQYEANLTLSFLQDTQSDRFDDIFLKNVHQEWIKYDNVFRIPVLLKKKSPFATLTSHLSSIVAQELQFYPTQSARMAISNLFTILSKGLGNRCKCIAIWTPSTLSWDIDSFNPTIQSIDEIIIGMVLDPETSLVQVEHGPASNDIELVKQFASLWGDRSEMRRFQDGSIRESVVFETDGSLAQKSVIVARMTAFLLSRHFSIGENDGVVYWAGIGGKFISLPSPTIPGKIKQDVVKSFTPVMDALQSLIREIKSLDLPLAIHRIHNCTDSLSYCSVFIPQPIEQHDFVSRCAPPSFLIEFESSGKWPEDIGAIETMKRAFYIQMATLLENSETKATVKVQGGADLNSAMEEEYFDPAINESFLELTLSSGYSFHVRIYHPRVGILLERAIKDAGSDFKTKAPLVAFHQDFEKRYVSTPTHYHFISNLCLRFPFLGTTIRLAKRWMASHLLLGDTCITDQVVELICVRIYTTPTAFGAPSSGWTGFVRVLDLLQSWQWMVEPLVVELQLEPMAVSVQDEINANYTSFMASRGINTPVLFISSEMDTKSSLFGSLKVATKVVQRLLVLAKQSLQVIQNQLVSGSNNDVTQLFCTSFEGYDAVIHLDSTRIARYFESVQFDPSKAPKRTSQFKNVMDIHDREFLEYSEIDVVQLYLHDLVKYFGEIAMFFADIYGGDKIAVVWKKPFLQPGPFKINLGYLAQVSSDGKSMKPNKLAIVGEMVRLGGNLVSDFHFDES